MNPNFPKTKYKYTLKRQGISLRTAIKITQTKAKKETQRTYETLPIFILKLDRIANKIIRYLGSFLHLSAFETFNFHL
jgi:hypothetical protein